MDKTGLMIDIMKMEVQKFNGIKEKFIDEFSKDDFDYIDQVCNISFPTERIFHFLQGWKDKQVRCSEGDQVNNKMSGLFIT